MLVVLLVLLDWLVLLATLLVFRKRPPRLFASRCWDASPFLSELLRIPALMVDRSDFVASFSIVSFVFSIRENIRIGFRLRLFCSLGALALLLP